MISILLESSSIAWTPSASEVSAHEQLASAAQPLPSDPKNNGFRNLVGFFVLP